MNACVCVYVCGSAAEFEIMAAVIQINLKTNHLFFVWDSHSQQASVLASF